MPLTKHAHHVMQGVFLAFCLFASSSQAAPDDPVSGLNLENFKKSDKYIKWKNNPFTQPVDDVSVPSLKLFAIVYNPQDSAALINRHVVRAGDKIGSTEVVSIQEREVVLRTSTGIFKLNFDDRKK
jgi:hypothetical protein